MAYKEFGGENRPQGWNAWATFVISPAGRAAAERKAAHGHEISWIKRHPLTSL